MIRLRTVKVVKKQMSEAIHLDHDRHARTENSANWPGLVVLIRNRLVSTSVWPNYNGVL